MFFLRDELEADDDPLGLVRGSVNALVIEVAAAVLVVAAWKLWPVLFA